MTEHGYEGTKKGFKFDDEELYPKPTNVVGGPQNRKVGKFDATVEGSGHQDTKPSEKVGEDSLPAMVDEKTVELDDRIR